MPTTLIVVPCYNEADRLTAATFTDFARKHAHVHILFVNDGSLDHTSNMINETAHELPDQIKTLHLTHNSGKAEAVRQGFLKGFEASYEFIGYLDADLAAPLEAMLELEELLRRSGKEIAMGARVALLGRHIARNELRHLAGRVFATCASHVLHLRVYDTQCGAKLFRMTDRLKRVFRIPFRVRWIFDVEILARFIITARGGRENSVEETTIEHPLQEWEDKKGSKLKFQDFLISVKDLFIIYRVLYSYRDDHPYLQTLRG